MILDKVVEGQKEYFISKVTISTMKIVLEVIEPISTFPFLSW